MEILLATNNPGKRQEYIDLAKEYSAGIKFILPKELNIYSDPIEDGKTYAENSMIKANAIASQTNMIVLADDAGIEIKALGEQFPGIYSHRYLETIDSLNQISDKCLNSEAKFHCSIVLLNYKKDPIICEGEVKGKIVEPHGTNGFGYDPIFMPDGYNKTFGEMPEKDKNKISHRANAFAKLMKLLNI